MLFLVGTLPVKAEDRNKEEISEVIITFNEETDKPKPPIRPDPPVLPKEPSILPKTGELITSLIITLIGVACLLIIIGVYTLKMIWMYSGTGIKHDINEIFI